ncbi:MAG: GNAT family N-acetyltransferase [Rhodoglobus sp.]
MIALPLGYSVRHTRETDHRAVVDAIGRWWDTPNRAMLGMLMPRLFLQFFTQTSWIVESESGDVGAFLIGFRSLDDPEICYIHFVGVDPEVRRTGLATVLYELFFEKMKASGCTEVRAITGSFNRRSQAFHEAMGFTAHGDREIDGVMAYPDYDGPGEPRVAFTRPL